MRWSLQLSKSLVFVLFFLIQGGIILCQNYPKHIPLLPPRQVPVTPHTVSSPQGKFLSGLNFIISQANYWAQVKKDVEATNLLLGINSNIRKDIESRGFSSCYFVYISFATPKSRLETTNVYIYGAPFQEVIVHGPISFHYKNHYNDPGSIIGKDQMIVHGWNSHSYYKRCNTESLKQILAQTESRYERAIQTTLDKLSQSLDGTHGLGIDQLPQQIETDLDHIAYQRTQTQNELRNCKKAQANAQVLRSEVKDLDEKLQHEKRTLKKLQEILIGPGLPEWGQACTCQEVHKTDFHKPGYYCEDWPQKIPCEDDYRCITRIRINEKKKEITKIEQTIFAHERQIYGENNKTSCDDLIEKLVTLDTQEEKIILLQQNIKKLENHFIKLSDYLEKLKRIELQIYRVCASQSNPSLQNEASKELVEGYQKVVAELKKNATLAYVFNHLEFPENPFNAWFISQQTVTLN